MNLSDSQTRGILIQSVNLYSKEWVHWRTSLDDQLDLSIECLAMNPNQRQQQILSELAKRYPLLVVRGIHLFTRTLKQDGSFSKYSDIEKRGRVNNLLNNEPMDARTSFGILKVRVTHWGYSFTEPLWTSVLEIIDSIPKEVLYACGIEMGLLDLLNLFMSLIAVQVEVGVSSYISILKSKLSQSLLIFKSSNRSEFDRWTASNLKELERKGSVSLLLSAYGMAQELLVDDKEII
uniref:Uncharacterized protein n=1 Tax=Eucampia antarctica TaxID=49252 RepID=A0A7S2W5F1_9STRA|eukprot:CAMPEP_0197829848 /NCGR_PEP_ID=MMETSP1437-20131217/6396_1 /TAXON_ID=49252 ORGANISM="Eucampia antarctica, Strain CCMP1452" /NCGR_SAMPLE_ID=MMETSP1437 /ASSEMBLY_ACC=CAM_ASM_001096 /LENGTH=234 /DNA_ID=CAMNT_0043431841 /DNA_START=38 /DNA_END=742 /DNA_ORIENTATION=+